MKEGSPKWLQEVTYYLSNRRHRIIGQFLVLILIAGLTVLVTIHREKLISLAEYGFTGIFLACFAANSTIFLPAPSSAIVFTFAYVYSPFWVAIVGGLGAAAGEVLGFLAGYTGKQMINPNTREGRLQAWVVKKGVLTVFVLAFLPLPLFDLVGVTAGALRMHFLRFLAPTLIGKVLKMLIYAYAGAGFLPIIEPIIMQAFRR